MCPVSEFVTAKYLVSTLFFNRFRWYTHTSAMMRAVDWTAAVVLCLLGYLVCKAVTKTLPGDTATEGKSTFNVIIQENGSLAGHVGG